MNDRINTKVVAYGTAAFVPAQILAFVASSRLPQSSDTTTTGNAFFLFIALSSNLIPFLVGFFVSYYAPHNRILHGALSVVLGAALFLLVARPSLAAFVAFALYSTFGLVGATLGSFIRGRAGA